MNIDFVLDWPEVLATLCFFAGLVLALMSGAFWAVYLISFLLGLLFGRIWFRQKSASKIPLTFCILLCLFGLFAGSFFAWIRWVTLFLTAGILLTYWLHSKGYIESSEFQ